MNSAIYDSNHFLLKVSNQRQLMEFILPKNLAQKLIESHLIEGNMKPGLEIHLQVDQVLLQDALGTLSMQALESIKLDRIRVNLACQYVDHNLLQTDFRSPDDHIYLKSCCEKLGIHFSRPGNGISHPTHQENFGVPGQLLAGTDSHTPANGAIAMLAIGVGSIEGAAILSGEPLSIPMPEVMGVKLTGSLQSWVSAKDIILELLRRHSVKGAVGRIIEYYGCGIATLSAMDRHVIANMGTELGATSSVFPSDETTSCFLKENGRFDDYTPISAEKGCNYDHHDEIDLSNLEPLIALPSSPDNVVKVREVEGAPIYQSYIGSSANPGYRDFAIAAMMLNERKVAPNVSLDINPSTRRVLTNLISMGYLNQLLVAGGRLHQTGCNGCNGMGQAPASGKNSLRTVPRNFPGRSGVKDDQVFLCSPETAVASAITGVITDPRDLAINYPVVRKPEQWILINDIEKPPSRALANLIEIERGPNISKIPDIEPILDEIELTVALKLDDNISTDSISPAGARALPYRSNIPKIAEMSFENIDQNYAKKWQKLSLRNIYHAIIAGENYGQGSSREHAAIAPQYLGLRLVIAKSFARIHWQNLINSAILPLKFQNSSDLCSIKAGDHLKIENLIESLSNGAESFDIIVSKRKFKFKAELKASKRQREILLAGGLLNWIKDKKLAYNK